MWVSTRGLSLSGGERLFVSAVAPRGIVAAPVASITAATLENQGIAGGEELKALVFLVIAVTVIVSGITARPLAAILGVRLPRRDRVAILGARGLALALADQLKAADIPVIFLESDPKRSRVAEEAGYPVIFGDPLDERTMLRARPELVGKAIALTFNEHFNSVFVRNALDAFDVPRGLVAMESLFGEEAPGLLPEEHADVLFDGPHDHERWDVRWRHEQVAIEEFTYEPPTPKETDLPASAGIDRHEIGGGEGSRALRHHRCQTRQARITDADALRVPQRRHRSRCHLRRGTSGSRLAARGTRVAPDRPLGSQAQKTAGAQIPPITKNIEQCQGPARHAHRDRTSGAGEIKCLSHGDNGRGQPPHGEQQRDLERVNSGEGPNHLKKPWSLGKPKGAEQLPHVCSGLRLMEQLRADEVDQNCPDDPAAHGNKCQPCAGSPRFRGEAWPADTGTQEGEQHDEKCLTSPPADRPRLLHRCSGPTARPRSIRVTNRGIPGPL